jgi:DNA-binding CsgD family transcriptional regulator
MTKSDLKPSMESRKLLISEFLRQVARERAATLKWNAYTAIMFYALLIIVALLQISGVNIFLIMGLAVFGLFVLLAVIQRRWRKMEDHLYEQEVDNYSKILLGADSPPVIEPPQIEGPKVPVISPLSNRELEVLTKIAEGMPNKKIAIELGISSQTVKNHIYHILAKLDVDDRTSAVVMAASRGWIQVSLRNGAGDIERLHS